jgi:two-component system OmpR family sensor kinase
LDTQPQELRGRSENFINSDTARAQLAALRPNGRMRFRSIDRLGEYRVVAAKTTLAVTVAVLVTAITAGILLIRRALQPLDRLSAAAARVADLALDRGGAPGQ